MRSTNLLGSLKRTGELIVATAQNRIELFSVELREEEYRFIEALLLVAAVIAFGVTALALVILTMVLLFWENGLVLVLCVMSLLLVGVTLVLARLLRKKLAGESAFGATVRELEKDRACFRSPD